MDICKAPTLRLKALNKHSIIYTMYIEMENVISIDFINPFTALSCKISGLKSARIHTRKQYLMVLEQSYL